MLTSIECAGKPYSVDFSLMTALQLCERYDVDVTGLAELFNSMSSQRQKLDFIIQLGIIAINDAAMREHRAERVDEFDVRDMLTLDVSFGQVLIEELFKALQVEEVFSKPPKKAARKSKTAAEE